MTTVSKPMNFHTLKISMSVKLRVVWGLTYSVTINVRRYILSLEDIWELFSVCGKPLHLHHIPPPYIDIHYMNE